MKQITDEQLDEIINLLSERRILQVKKKLEDLKVMKDIKNIKEKRSRCQFIILESGLEVIIDHNSKTTCDKCNKGIVWSSIPLELVSLARWDVHKCEVKNLKLKLNELQEGGEQSNGRSTKNKNDKFCT